MWDENEGTSGEKKHFYEKKMVGRIKQKYEFYDYYTLISRVFITTKKIKLNP